MILRQIIRLFRLTALATLPLATGCMVERPGVKDSARMLAAFSHMGTETTCTACHEVDRPIAAADVAHGGGADCVSCHSSSGGWLGGLTQFSHTPLPLSCVSCHDADRPSGRINGFDHSIEGMGDCVRCHAAQPANAGATWAGAIYDHKNQAGLVVGYCTSCHEPQRPTGLVASGFDHGTQAPSTQDCATCHRNPGIDWSGGAFNHSPLPASCSSCHAGSRPAETIAVPTWTAGTPPPAGQFLHAARFKGMDDCVSCHAGQPANVGVTFAGGSFDHLEQNPLTGAIAGVTTCKDCHEPQRPAPMGGVAHGAGGDCVQCHNTVGHVGVDWSGAQGMPHGVTGSTTGSTLNCVNCHGNTGSSAHRLTVAASAHMGGTSNTCTSCHISFAGFSGSTTLVRYAHNYGTGINTPDCKTCHNFVAGAYRSYTDSSWSLSQIAMMPAKSFGGQSFTRNHTVSGTDANMSNCLACHRYAAPTAGSTPAARWSWRHNAPNMTKPQGTGRAGCTVCHEHL